MNSVLGDRAPSSLCISRHQVAINPRCFRIQHESLFHQADRWSVFALDEVRDAQPDQTVEPGWVERGEAHCASKVTSGPIWLIQIVCYPAAPQMHERCARIQAQRPIEQNARAHLVSDEATGGGNNG